MIYSYYDEIMNMSGESGTAMYKKLIDIGIGHIFDYAWHKYHPANNFLPIVLYTAHAYSWESKLITISGDWQKQKLRIAGRVNLPEYLTDDVVNLKDTILYECFHEYLHLYHEEMDYVHLTNLKELYQQVMMEASRFQADDDGRSNLPAKLKYIENAGELKEKIKQLAEEMTGKYKILIGPKSDFNGDQEGGNLLKVENSPLIR